MLSCWWTEERHTVQLAILPRCFDFVPSAHHQPLPPHPPRRLAGVRRKRAVGTTPSISLHAIDRHTSKATPTLWSDRLACRQHFGPAAAISFPLPGESERRTAACYNGVDDVGRRRLAWLPNSTRSIADSHRSLATLLRERLRLSSSLAVIIAANAWVLIRRRLGRRVPSESSFQHVSTLGQQQGRIWLMRSLGTFPQRRVHYVQYQYFFILHFTYLGGAYAPNEPPPPTGLGFTTKVNHA